MRVVAIHDWRLANYCLAWCGSVSLLDGRKVFSWVWGQLEKDVCSSLEPLVSSYVILSCFCSGC